ncbi:Crustacean calcium-binding protein 23 [Chionoecetes opilio]|uniref:Crustacean calcium-binding protein 23 n=1 Tax=Chionoecetes opilio TaxID=41210 RepID=A0A8J5CPL7_CHIOP|nr:Crustacean calcium-binding protein 23 [Chionoecetes opilio]
MTHEEDMKEAALAAAEEAETPIDKLRCLCLNRGYNGIMQFGRLFRIADSDGSHTLNQEELAEALQNFGLEFSEDEVAEIFSSMDEDETGSINYDEFLEKLRPEMTEDRVAVALEAFAKLDESGDGMVTLEDVKANYDASNHPKVLSDEMSEDDVLSTFLGRFEGNTKQDGEAFIDPSDPSIIPFLTPKAFIHPFLTPKAFIHPFLTPKAFIHPFLTPKAFIHPFLTPKAFIDPFLTPKAFIDPFLTPKAFIDPFLTPKAFIDPQVTKEEFLEYYSGVSKSIDEDEYFVEMMKQAWKL